MTRLLCTSDWHVDATTAGLSRASELEQYLEGLYRRLADTARPAIDAVLFCGDLCDPGGLLASRWTSMALQAIGVLGATHRVPSLWIAGNHDVVEDSGGWTTLSPLAAAVEGELTGETPVVVAETPKCVELSEQVSVLMLPYVARVVERGENYAADRKIAMERAARHRAAGGRLVVMGHFTIPGIVPGSEEELGRGRAMLFPAEELAALSPSVVLNGHYHARQTLRIEGMRVEIPGAPIRMTFGEREDGDRGWLEIEL